MTTEEDARSSVVSQISRHAHDRFSCGTLLPTTVMSNSVSPSPLSMGQVDNLSCPFLGIPSREKANLKGALKSNSENNHLASSPVAYSAVSTELNDEHFCETSPSKLARTAVDSDDFKTNLVLQANSIPPLCSSPSTVFHTNCSTADSQLSNGLTNVPFLECNTGNTTPPVGDASGDLNGHSGPQTPPVSPNDSDRAKMDLAKLDETIDYVISNAVSDDPVEGMFILTCRLREPMHLCSPNLRANTPSSGHFVSPSPSPTPSSPHSSRVTSPMVYTTTKAHAVVPTNNVSSVPASPLSRYMVDQTTGLVQLSPCSVASQYTQYNNQHSVSFVQLHPDSIPPKAPTLEHVSVHASHPKTPTQTFLPSAAVQAFQHQSPMPSFIARPSVTVYQNCTTLTSPPKLLSVRPGTSPMQNIALMPSSPVRTVTHSLDGISVCSTRPVHLISSPTSVCYVQNAVLTNSAAVVSESTPDRLAAQQFASFRQPIVPAQSLVCTSSPPTQHPPPPAQVSVSDHSTMQSIGQNLLISDAGEHGLQAVVVGTGRKRGHSTNNNASKRRKTSSSVMSTSCALANTGAGNKVAQSVDLYRTSHWSEFMEKLKSSDTKMLVSAPVLRPYSATLPPVGGSDCLSLCTSEEDEESILTRRGLKYAKGSLSLNVPKYLVSDGYQEKVDNYVSHHLWPAASTCPVLRRPKSSVPQVGPIPNAMVPPSPEPVSFENHMMALFSSIHRSPKLEDKSRCLSDRLESASGQGDNFLTTKLLPIFSEAASRSDQPDPERSTPPLPLFHVPNPKLISETSQLTSADRGDYRTHSASSVISTVVSNNGSSDVPRIGVDSAMDDHSRTSNSEMGDDTPLIDSETGELVVRSRQHPPDSEVTPSDKLHITFSINSSTNNGIPRIVQRIAELLGIEQEAVCYEITRSGAQITLDQNKSSNVNLVKDLECQLREHFTPLSLHLEKGASSQVDSQNASTNCFRSSPTLDSTHEVPQPTLTNSSSKSLVEGPVYRKTELCHSWGQDSVRYTEEPINISSLASTKSVATRSCANCDKLVPPHSGLHKCLEDLATLTGLNVRSDSSGDFIFCSSECVFDYARFLSTNRSSSEPASYETSGGGSEVWSQSLACDLQSTVPIVLQCCSVKTGKQLKRQPVGPQPRRKRSASGQTKQKRWYGSRWRVFSSDTLPHNTVKAGKAVLDDATALQLSMDRCAPLRLPQKTDSRTCQLCHVVGDVSEDTVGRLLPLDVNKWIHLNCALWCYEVYETVGGSLNNVHVWVQKALETSCARCGHLGAGLPCYNPRCTLSYHVPCALAIGCMFFTDRGMYCPQHQPREAHPMQLSSLAVHRRVYIARDENAQVGSVIHEEEQCDVVRIGTVCLHNLGQLLPHQIESGLFHTRRYIYPVGFRSTRIYWSMRVPRARAMYVCEIVESDGRALFRVTACDSGLENESVEDWTCSGVWQSILARIKLLREQSEFVKVFAEHLKGEDLYGLSEPHIVRAVESLPGVDCLHDYVFNFGRMELIAEMPLAVNPSGCARCEPKMQTYVKRTLNSIHGSSVSTGRTVLPGLRRSSHPYLTNSISTESSKQYQSSRSQQYRRLKCEVTGNVILGRSRIQGMGLFAARDLEPQTMVIEYIGELIRLELANKREKEYESHNRGIYMFRLDEDTVIDATMCGGLARYINHSCQPNCFAEHLSFGDHSHIVIITNRHIDKGEELCYDYNFDFEDTVNKIPCLCRAPGCRKWMN